MQLKTHGGNWTVCTCAVRDLCFGLEVDVREKRGDKRRGIDPMPDKCWRFEK